MADAGKRGVIAALPTAAEGALAQATNQTTKLESLQMLRGIAACMVMLYHTGSLYAVHTGQLLWHNVFRAGFSGVEVFFVLSGVVIYWVHGSDVGRPERARNFLVRRGFRLFPVYWFVVALKVLKDPSAVTSATLVTAVLLLPAAPPFINVSWTLTYELLFYLAFLLWIVLPRTRVSAWPLGVLLLMAVLPMPPVSPGGAFAVWLQFLFNPHLAVFVFGVAVAWLLRRHGPAPLPLAYALAVGGMLAFALSALAGTWIAGMGDTGPGAEVVSAHEMAELKSNWLFDLGVLFFGVPAACAVAGLLSLELQGKFRAPFASVLTWLGDISYSLYLTHAFVIHILLSRTDFRALAASNPATLAAAWLVALLLAWVLYRCVEKPAMALGRRFAKPLPSVRSTV
jgi:peptidoglycan/LPS O-acetylase OafA/YrhL